MLNQVFVLFILMAVGYFAIKFGMIDENGVRQITTILCYIVSPCIIIFAFQMQYTTSLMTGFFIATASSVGIHLFAAIISRFIYNKKTVKDKDTRNIMKFATVYANCGFMGYPLLQAVAGTTGLFYGSAFGGVFNLFSWSHGMTLFNGKTDKKSLLKVLINPNILAVLAGIIMFRFSLKFPLPAYNALKYISDLNTPLSMIIIGTSISRIPLRSIFSERLGWIIVFMRNLAVPFCLMFALHNLGISGQLLLCCVIPAACPVAGATVLFANLVGKESKLPAKLVTLSTIMSLFTVPAVIYAISILKF